jgi:bZIP transcription factor
MMDESISSDEEVSASASTFARQRRIEQRRQGIKRRQDYPDESYGSESDNDDDDSYSSLAAVGKESSKRSSKKPRLVATTGNLSLIRGIKKQARYEPEVPMPKSELAKWRKEARRVRNRESAAASRHKTRLRIEELETQVAQLQGHCHDLEQLVARLQGQEATAAAAATAVPDEASVISCVSPLLSPTVIALDNSTVPQETIPHWTLPQQTAAQALADSVSADNENVALSPLFDTKEQNAKDLCRDHPRGLEDGALLYPTHQNLMISRPIAI